MKRCILAIACLTLLAAASARAAEPRTIEEVIAAVAQAAASIETWSTDTEMTMDMGGMTMTMTGTMQGKGGQVISEANLDMLGQVMKTRTVLGADGIQWIEIDMMGQKQVMKMDMNVMKDLGEKMLGFSMPGPNSLPGETQDPTRILEMFGESYDLEFAGIETLDDLKVYAITGNMKEGLVGDGDAAEMLAQMIEMMGKIKLLIGAEDGFIRSMQMLGPDDAPVMSTMYKNVVLNAPMDDSVFDYSPPEGVDVMDMSKMLDATFDGGQGNDVFGGKVDVGDVAPDFEATTLDGTPFKLSDYRGKFVLLDFWATWCSPCVVELPNVIEAYETYHDQGFEIIGISLDDDRDALDTFMTQWPAMTWTQVFDGKGWESRVGRLYGVTAIPHTLLLDKEGKVFAKDLRGDALSSALAEMLAATD